MKYFAAALLAATSNAVSLEWRRPVSHEHSYIEPVTSYETVYDTTYKTEEKKHTKSVPKTIYEDDTEIRYRDVTEQNSRTKF